MKRRPLIFAVVAVLLSAAAFKVRSDVSKIQRSKPGGVGFAMSHKPGVGQRAVLLQRWTTTDKGLPMTTTRVVLPANDTLQAAYKNKSGSPPEHFHLYQSSKFTTIRGKAGYVLDGVESVLEPGNSVTLPHLHPHTFWNAVPDEETEVQEEIVTHVGNSTDFAGALETLFGLSRDFGGLDNVNPLQLLLTFQVATC
ncbi:hypothetical protein WJX73_009256 [Symbiochloris irregularis]|uniref:Cupin 2 conserved barrel domain-containing protein n=1 Tax=Symbiochloris irregularis TaxID=706552 RepID=A0AAW1Q258_9CHLO